MTAILLILIKIYLFCWIFTEFEPLQNLINHLFLRLPTNYVLDYIWIGMSCLKCMCLWITLIVTHSVIFALAMSMVAQLHGKIITPK